MTVASTVNRITYTTSGGSTYAYTFRIFAKTDLVVYVAGILKAVDTDYTVTGVGVTGGGNIVFKVGKIPPAGQTLIIVRALPLTQLTDYQEGDPFPAETHEAALDRLIMITQQGQEILDRCLQVAQTSLLTNITVQEGLNKFLKWNALGTGIEAENVVPEGQDLSDYAKLIGRAGGQIFYGGTGSGDCLNLQSTTHATKGKIYLGAIGYFDEAASIYRELDIGSGTKLNPDYDDYSTVIIHRNLTAAVNEYGLTVAVDVPSFSPTGEKEKVAILGEIRNQAGSAGGNLANAAGVLGSGTIYGTSTGRVWGGCFNAVVSAGADGLAFGAEVASMNMGAVQASVDQLTSKYALWLTAQKEGGANASTAAICMSQAESLAFYYGFFMRWIGNTYIVMNNPAAANARGIDVDNNANWNSAFIRMPNNVNICAWNSTQAADYQLIGLNSNHQINIGIAAPAAIDLGYGATQGSPIAIRVGGVNSKTIEVGDPDSGGGGYRMLRTLN